METHSVRQIKTHFLEEDKPVDLITKEKFR